MRFFSLKKIISPFGRWTLFLVLLPILELFIMISFLGTLLTLLSMLVSGMIGVFVAYRAGLHCWAELNRQLDCGESPMQSVFHGVLILSAATFMILPGFLTSLLGLFLLFRLPRSLVVSYLVLQFKLYRLQTRKQDAPRSPAIIDI
jgi:UPF0716 protein FxsA